MAGIDGITHFDESGLEIRGGKLAERFARGEQIGAASIGSTSGENGAGFDNPPSVTLNQDEAFVGRNRGNPADELGGLGFDGGFRLRFCRFFDGSVVMMSLRKVPSPRSKSLPASIQGEPGERR